MHSALLTSSVEICLVIMLEEVVAAHFLFEGSEGQSCGETEEHAVAIFCWKLVHGGH